MKKDEMSDKRICKYCGMELSEDVPHGLRECHLHAVSRIAGMEWDFKWREESISTIEHALVNNEDNIEMLESRIAELEEKQRWRVVAEGELPEVYRDEDGDFIPFLVCEGDGGNPFVAMYNGIKWWAGIFVPDITHWMPLPELPEVQE